MKNSKDNEITKLVDGILFEINGDRIIDWLIKMYNSDLLDVLKDIDNELSYAKNETNSYPLQKKEALTRAKTFKNISKKYSLILSKLKEIQSLKSEIKKMEL